MTDTRGDLRILGRLAAVDGKGVVRMQDRFETSVEDMWPALTQPERLARWLGEIDGDLRLGGEIYARFADGYENPGRIEVCEPPTRLRLLMATGRPDEQTIEARLTADGDHTVLVWEERGMPLEQIAGYGAGIQIHLEDLADHLAGHERGDIVARWKQLLPGYQEMPVEDA